MQMSETIPVYLIHGFLESGKTTFIRDTINADYFAIDDTTLVIACEEGEEEYDQASLDSAHAVVEYLEAETDFTIRNLRAMEQKYNPARIIIEYNGMWDAKNILLPHTWHLEEQITLLDANTFSVYFNNMKAQVGDKLRGSDVVVMNRCDNHMEELPGWRRAIRAINQMGDIIFEDANGEIDNLDAEDLPYDINQDNIVLDDHTYAIWYLDSMEHPDRYKGKSVTFLAMAMHGEDYPEDWFIPGRIAMVCCENDVAFLGYPCRWEGEKNTPDQTWITVTAKFDMRPWFEYQGMGPVLYAEKVELAEQPENIVVGIG